MLIKARFSDFTDYLAFLIYQLFINLVFSDVFQFLLIILLFLCLVDIIILWQLNNLSLFFLKGEDV